MFSTTQHFVLVLNKLKILGVTNNIQKGGFMTTNQLRYWELQENKRHQRVVENETQRSNIARERETIRSNVAGELNNRYATNMQFRLGYLNYLENNRANLVREENTRYSNYTARLEQAERQRSNLANESIATGNLIATVGRNVEQMRANLVSEQLKRQDQSLTATKMDRDFVISLGNLAETERSHKANEDIAYASQAIDVRKLDETIRHNQAVEIETKRNNLIQNQQKNVDLINDANRIKFTTLANVLGNLTPNIRVGLGGTR